MKLSKKSGVNKLYQELISDGEVMRVSLELVDRDENQPRSLEEVKKAAIDLQPSIKINGVVQMPVYLAKPDGRYLIIVGECRTAGAKLNGDLDIAAVIKSYADDAEAKKQIQEIRYAENDPKTRKNLTPLDEAEFWFKYIEEFYTDQNGKPQLKEAAEYLGQNKNKISQFLGIHRASAAIKALIIKHKITDYQLAYILARMEHYPGLVDNFIAKLETDGIKGGIQVMANKMLKDAKELAHTESQAGKGLDLPPRTAAQQAKDREKENQTIATENQLKESLKSLERTENQAQPETNEQPPEQTQEEQEAANETQQSTTENQEQTAGADVQSDSIEFSNDMKLPANTGMLLLKQNPKTVVFSTVANQPVTLIMDQIKELIFQLEKWVNENDE